MTGGESHGEPGLAFPDLGYELAQSGALTNVDRVLASSGRAALPYPEAAACDRGETTADGPPEAVKVRTCVAGMPPRVSA
jgi:hypothetical protein